MKFPPVSHLASTCAALVLLGSSAPVLAQSATLTLSDSLHLLPGTGDTGFTLRSNGVLLGYGIQSTGFFTSLLEAGDWRNGPLLMWDPGTSSFQAAEVWDGMPPLGLVSAAFGWGNASGYGAFAAGEAWASGDASAAFGFSIAHSYSLTFGETTMTTGMWALAGGFATVAEGDYSTALGQISRASGDASTALGEHTISGAYASVAIGRYNLGNYYNPTGTPLENRGNKAWVATDPIFEIGNGTSAVRSNAFTVYKNGNVIIPKRQGDILMGEFGNPGN